MTIPKNLFMLNTFVLSIFLAGCVLVAPANNVAIADVLALQHKQQGIIYSNLGDYSNAINEFKRSVEILEDANTFANLGGAYMQVGKNNLAKKALARAEELDQHEPLALYNLTALYSKLDDTDLALEYLDRALANGFKNFDAIRFDPDLTNIRGEPEFRKVLEKNKVFIQ